MNTPKLVVVIAILCLTLHVCPAQRLGGGGEAHPALQTNRVSLNKWKDMRQVTVLVVLPDGPVNLYRESKK